MLSSLFGSSTAAVSRAASPAAPASSSSRPPGVVDGTLREAPSSTSSSRVDARHVGTSDRRCERAGCQHLRSQRRQRSHVLFRGPTARRNLPVCSLRPPFSPWEATGLGGSPVAGRGAAATPTGGARRPAGRCCRSGANPARSAGWPAPSRVLRRAPVAPPLFRFGLDGSRRTPAASGPHGDTPAKRWGGARRPLDDRGGLATEVRSLEARMARPLPDAALDDALQARPSCSACRRGTGSFRASS